ncbi:hypothetical protein ETB97_009555 [Aspergillus alliaceus]|uniref:Uncharacterized protein n=1 Tax=Petromyces alliaceus TaxID=209559 RepID=A0A8H5ZRW6_PETAA|nr:hypothetical protein ETB97_009555 [Aspergillus burnettii]
MHPGGCSCNLGKLAKVQAATTEKADQCADNIIKLNQQGAYKEAMAYGKACSCCGQSGKIFSIWDVCPNTIPSIIGADVWYEVLLKNNDWGQCGTSLEGVNCPADLEFTNQTKYHTPGKLPVNGTESLYNTGGVISTPVSGNISIWTMRDVLYPITAAATNKAVPTKSESGDKGATTTSAESKAGYQLGMSLWVTVGAISTAFLAIAI